MPFQKVLMSKKVNEVEVSLVRRNAGWDGWKDVPKAWIVRTNNLHPTHPKWLHRVFLDAHEALEVYCEVY